MTKERAVAVALVGAGVWQCIAQGEAINADGISYLDMARQFASGDASPIANGYWSPAYPMILAVALRLFGWMPVREISIVYGINIALMLLAAWSFRALLTALSAKHEAPGTRHLFGDTWTRGAAWALFAWSVIRMISVASVTPDMLVAAQLFFASALIARRVRGKLSRREVLLFGAVVASAYLTKAVMFPAGLVLLVAYALASRKASEIAAVAAAFVVVATPLVVAQSVSAGRFSIGETGRLNYAWFVNAERPNTELPNSRTPELRSPSVKRQASSAVALSSVPGAKLYADSAPGTYPYWYDPSKWSPGVSPRWNAGEQWSVLRVTGRWYRMVVWLPLLLVVVFAGMAMEAQRKPRWTLWPLLLAPAAMMAMYALIHVEGRLVGAPLLVALIALMAIADADEKPQAQSREWLCAALIAFGAWGSVERLLRGPRLGESRDASGVAAALKAAGVERGADVAVLGSSPLDMGAYWAHVAGVRIVATIPSGAASELSKESMAAVAAESCAHGRTLTAFVGRDESWARAVAATSLGDGWFAWKVTPCRPERSEGP